MKRDPDAKGECAADAAEIEEGEAEAGLLQAEAIDGECAGQPAQRKVDGGEADEECYPERDGVAADGTGEDLVQVVIADVAIVWRGKDGDIGGNGAADLLKDVTQVGVVFGIFDEKTWRLQKPEPEDGEEQKGTGAADDEEDAPAVVDEKVRGEEAGQHAADGEADDGGDDSGGTAVGGGVLGSEGGDGG